MLILKGPRNGSGSARRVLALAVLCAQILSACAGSPIAERGVRVFNTGIPYAQLITRLRSAIRNNGMEILEGACGRCGIRTLDAPAADALIITVSQPGLMLRMLQAGAAMGAEPPLRFYVSHGAGGSTRLTYHQPSATLAIYRAPGLIPLARRLDQVFAAIAHDALAAVPGA